MKINNTMMVRQQNALLILRELENCVSSTNTEIANKYHLSIATVSNIVNILKYNNLLISRCAAVSSGGRKPMQLSLNPEYNHYIGVNISKHVLYFVLIDFKGTILAKTSVYLDYKDSEEYWSQVKTLMDNFGKDAGITSYEIGIAVPGFVDYSLDQIADTRTLGVPSISISLISSVFGEDIYIGDSCRVAGQAQVFGKDTYRDSFFILLSRRVSGILIHNKKPFHLEASSFGIGSMLINPSQHSGQYGIPGSFAELCNASRIIDTLIQDGHNIRYTEFFEKVRSGVPYFTDLWDSYLDNLVIALHNLYVIFRTDIVIGGEMAKYLVHFPQQIHEKLLRTLPDDFTTDFLHFSNYGEYDDAFGAALERRNHSLTDQIPSIMQNYE